MRIDKIVPDSMARLVAGAFCFFACLFVIGVFFAGRLQLVTTCLIVGTMPILIFGFRNQIQVTIGRVIIRKKWYMLTYRVFKADSIDDISFNGNWGDDFDACGLVLVLNGKERFIGSKKYMRELYDELSPYWSAEVQSRKIEEKTIQKLDN